MKYRIMKIGDKYAAQLVNPDGTGGSYIDDKGDCLFHKPSSVLKYCVFNSIENAKNAAEVYIKTQLDVINAEEVLEKAQEVKEEPCPVCNSPIETNQYYDCCSAQCYKDKHI